MLRPLFSFGVGLLSMISVLVVLRPSPKKDLMIADPLSPFALVELFTSEGCSSCPPADAVLSQLVAKAEEENQAVFALSFHVDYWNYLGWKDPFSDAAYSQRQRAYASHLGSSVYTPQMIVNGQEEFVGSRRSEAITNIGNALQQSAAVAIDLELTDVSNAILTLKYAVQDAPADAILHFALAEGPIQIAVNRGENRGRNLSHDNIVRAFVSKPVTAKGELNLRIPDGVQLEHCRLIAYVQEGSVGTILGATGLSIRS